MGHGLLISRNLLYIYIYIAYSLSRERSSPYPSITSHLRFKMYTVSYFYVALISNSILNIPSVEYTCVESDDPKRQISLSEELNDTFIAVNRQINILPNNSFVCFEFMQVNYSFANNASANILILDIFIICLILMNYLMEFYFIGVVNAHLPGCFCPWTFRLNIGLNTSPSDSFVSYLNSHLGYSAGEFQALQLIVLAVFGAVD